MSELLLELFSEEIPARMQARAEDDLRRLLEARLNDAGLKADSLETFSGPRRIGFVATGLPEKTEDVREERKGPQITAPKQAIDGFLRSVGFDSVDQCTIKDLKKGKVYIASFEKPGRKTTEVIADAIPAIVKEFPWPKSMKFGEGDKTQRWVRPLHRITCLFAGEVIPFEVFGIQSGNTTEGHRIHSQGDRVLSVTNYDDYLLNLQKNGVMLKREVRRKMILEGARQVCLDAGLELVEDEGLLEEVTGLVEYPVPVLGEMDPDFLDLPPEVITLTMKVHQKYFAVRNPKTGELAPKFVMLANQDAPDGGKAIAEGAARVLSARLSDARHFWDLDLAKGLEAMAPELSKVTFHEKLGTVADKVERVAALARELAPSVDADPDLAEQAARLSKADLVSQMVYEFPELQGVMGRYYALEGGFDPQIADAIRDHYKPQGPSDEVPTAPVSAAVALADKLDTLVGFWAIDEKPTGSKDPFALRRAALGIIRILLDSNQRLSLSEASQAAQLDRSFEDLKSATLNSSPLGTTAIGAGEYVKAIADLNNLLSFFADRLKVHLKDEGIRYDVIDAVFAPRQDGTSDDDLVRVTNKARALQAFLETDDGEALLAGYRRAANILKAEEKKDGESYDGEPSPDYLKSAPESSERDLITAIETASTDATKATETEDFAAAMTALSTLRGPVDAFFDNVVVNAENEELRRNRLLLLSRIRAAVHTVADFSRLEG